MGDVRYGPVVMVLELELEVARFEHQRWLCPLCPWVGHFYLYYLSSPRKNGYLLRQ